LVTDTTFDTPSPARSTTGSLRLAIVAGTSAVTDAPDAMRSATMEARRRTAGISRSN
jgi:hypothetical protein